MAVSEVTIINDALGHLGEPTVNNRDDNTTQGKAANRFFDSTKEHFLSQHNWRFATKYVQLAQIATNPDFKYGKAYQLPSDFIRLIEINETDVDAVAEPLYEKVGNAIYTDETSVKIAYVSNVDASFFSAEAAMAMSFLLAKNMSRLLTDSATQRKEMADEAKRELIRARSIDSRHQRQPLEDKTVYSKFVQTHRRSSNVFPTPTVS